MIRYYITDRKALGGDDALIENVERLSDSIDYIQIREKDLSADALTRLAFSIRKAAAPGVRVLVNDRADVAIVCGCAGVHLRADSISPAEIRRFAPESFVISVACHGREDVLRAGVEGADLALLAPVFATPAKGEPLGLYQLALAADEAAIPLVALGGVTPGRIAACISAGASGVAGIRLFQQPRLQAESVRIWGS